MGKGKRIREARRQESPRRSPFDLLRECVISVGDRFGPSAQCVEAAAVLQRAGELLGFTLTVRPVGLIAQDAATGSITVMGRSALEHVPAEMLGALIDARPEGEQGTGHVVLTCSEPPLLLDPTLRQLARTEIHAPSLMLKIASPQPSTGYWEAELGSLRVRYIVVDDDRSLLGDFPTIAASWSREGDELVRLLLAGETADSLLRDANSRGVGLGDSRLR